MDDSFTSYITKLLKPNFRHLDYVNQNYSEHLKDSMSYSWESLKGSFYFFCHGIYPDIFEKNGSETIHFLDERLQKKFEEIQQQNEKK